MNPRILFLVLTLLVLTPTTYAATVNLSNGQTLNLSSASSGDPSPDAVVDLAAFTCNCGINMGLTHQNGSRRASPNVGSYAAMTLSEARSLAYSGSDGGGGFGISEDELFYIRTGTAPNSKYFRVRAISNGGGVLSLEYSWLGTGDLVPPNSAFTFNTYDLWANFSNTSTGTPTNYSWNFADSTSSTQEDPRHRFAAAGTYNVCLTASNGGGPDATPFCTNVSVSQVSSISAAPGSAFDLDSNGVNDLAVAATGACGGIPNSIAGINGGGVATLGIDYRTISAAHIAGQSFSSGVTCIGSFSGDQYRDYLNGFLASTSDGDVYKVWIADNSGAGIRIERALLQQGLPPPPVANFTFTTYDLFALFDDSSTQSPSAWAWNFGDGQQATSQNPEHRYDSAGTYGACLVAGNLGGDSAQTCKNVNVAQVVSTTRSDGQSFDFNDDGISDLSVDTAPGCGSLPNILVPQNGAQFQTLNKDYRLVTMADLGTLSGGSSFCTAVDFREPFILRLGQGNFYRAWTAANGGSGVRIESALLAANLLFDDGFE